MLGLFKRAKQLRKPLASLVAQEAFSTRARGYQHFQSRKPGFSWAPSQRTLLVLGGGGAIFYWSNQQEIPYSNRRHFILVPLSVEQSLGEETFKQVKESAAKKGTLYPENSAEVQRVRKIGLKIAEIAAKNKGGGFTGHMENIKWEFAVIQSADSNAFVAPGGKVVVFSGLLDMVGRDDDQLAAVLAHEAGHTLARHVGEKLTWTSLSQVVWLAVYLGTGIPIPQGFLTAAIDLPNSRKLELEADAIGLSLGAQACYNPEASVTVFQKFHKIEQDHGADRIPGFLRTHPISTARIEAIRRNLAAAQSLFQSSGCQQRETFFRRAIKPPQLSWDGNTGFF